MEVVGTGVGFPVAGKTHRFHEDTVDWMLKKGWVTLPSKKSKSPKNKGNNGLVRLDTNLGKTADTDNGAGDGLVSASELGGGGGESLGDGLSVGNEKS